MDWSNQEVLNSPNLSYTSKDYNSIYTDLLSTLNNLSKVYKPSDETDPGIILIKIISMLGDMLSHTSDINALEVFPATVLQLPNAQQIFRLVGYKMKWYRSAHCEAYFTNSNSVPISIGRFNTFTAKNGKYYTNLTPIKIPAGASIATKVTANLVQGTPVTPTLLNTSSKPYYTGEWYDNYGFNVNAKTDVYDNRIYLSGIAVDGSTICLVDNDTSAFNTNEWQQVENLNTVTEVGKFFEFDFDSDGQPYIILPDYWNENYVITQFKLFYVVSDGAEGEITDNALVEISTKNVYVNAEGDANMYLDNVKIYNTSSTYGNSPETPDEGRKNAELYVNTVDTLIVLKDFEKATRRIEGVANVIATDKQTDPDGANMLTDVIKLYIIRKEGYTDGFTLYDDTNNEFNVITDDIWAQEVVEELKNHVLANYYEIQPLFENSIDWIDWTIRGSLWLRQPVPRDKNHDILVQINNGLIETFSPSILNFREAINYIDVIDNIKAADKLIYHVDLDTAAIEYSRIRRDHHGNKTGLTVKTKYKIFDLNGNYTYYYANGFGCAPIPGGDGTNSGTGFRILREDGATWVTNGLNFGTDNVVNEFEIYNNDIYNWTGETRKETGYAVSTDEPNSSSGFIYKKVSGSPENKTQVVYTIKCELPIYLSDGKESEEYLKEGTWNNKEVYEIWNSEYNQWTSKFIDRATGEMFVVRNGEAYSMNRFCDVDNGETDIVDGFGMPLLDDNDRIIRDPVAREELTGRYEQVIIPKEASEAEKAEYPDEKYSRNYDFYLGQTHEGEPLFDSIGNRIVGFPITPDGLHIMIDTDRYIIHDNGSGVLTSSNGILDGYGSVDYSTGHVKFTLSADIEKELTTDISKAIRIVYQKNVITMARYNQFDPDTFYIQPQFLRYSNATRSLG